MWELNYGSLLRLYQLFIQSSFHPRQKLALRSGVICLEILVGGAAPISLVPKGRSRNWHCSAWMELVLE